MLARFHLVSIVFLIALSAPFAGASAQAPSNAQSNPILALGKPWAFDGFSVVLPSGHGWYSLAKDARYADLARELDNGVKAAAVVEVRKLDESVGSEKALLDLIKAEQSATPPSGSMKLLDYNAEPFAPKGVSCARFTVKYEDHRKDLPVGVLRVGGVGCVAPSAADTVVVLRYAQRTVDDAPLPELVAEQDAFLNSLRFSQYDKPAIDKARVAIRGDKPEQAAALLQPLAESGDTEAALFLGNMYLYGRGVAVDYSQARKWLERAANDGRSDASYNLGAIYDKGLGVTRDPAEAMRWFKLAADQRDNQAQLNIALFYFKGDGVAKDTAETLKWLRYSAGNGNKRAQGIIDMEKYKQ